MSRRGIATVGVMAASLALACLPAFANTINFTIDGDLSEWTGPTFSHQDGDDATLLDDRYDIDWNHQSYGIFSGDQDVPQNMMVSFAITTLEDWLPDDVLYDAYFELIFDTTQSAGGSRQGLSGVDYYAGVTVDTGSTGILQENTTYNVRLYKWTGAAFANQGNKVQFAYDKSDAGAAYAATEWGIYWSDLGLVWGDYFGWTGFLDTYNTLEDWCPNADEGDWAWDQDYQTGIIPEPGTAALFLAGFAGLMVTRRRRS